MSWKYIGTAFNSWKYIGTAFNAWKYVGTSPTTYQPAETTVTPLIWLDGTISGNEFVDKSGNGRNFTITNKDFTASYFPYKSIATISAPAADTVLIAADINNFLYDSGGTPNEIPVTSLFQNIDYENKLFCKHIDQTVDGNGVETQEPYVTDIVLYASVLTGADLQTANIYYSVPTEQTSNVQWVAKDGNDTTGDGSKALPWLTLNKGFTEAAGTDRIYIKTGEYAERITVNSNLELFGLGLVIQNPADYCLYATADITITANHFYFERDDNIAIRAFVNYTGTWTFNNCKVDGAAAFYKTAGSDGVLTVNNCVIDGKFTTMMAILNLNTILFNDSDDSAISIWNTLNSTNSKYKQLSTSGIIEPKQTGFDVNCLGDNISDIMVKDLSAAYAGNITFDRCTITPVNGVIESLLSYTAALNLTYTYCTINSDGTSADLIDFVNTGDVVFENNTINDVNGSVKFDGSIVGQSASIKDNSFISDYEHSILVTDYNTDFQTNIMNSEVGSRVLIKCATVDVSPATIKNNIIISKTDAVGIVLQLGVEGVPASEGYLDGSIIEQNAIYGPQYFGNSAGSVHSILVYDQEAHVRYNYMNGNFLGIVMKHEGSLVTNTAVYYNLVINCPGALLSKGIQGVKYYNNTVVWESVNLGYGIKAQFDDGYPGSYSDFTIIKNNIFVDNYTATPGQGAIQFEHANDYANSESDYNTVYSKNSTKFGTLAGTDYNLAGWQGQGFGTNSQDLSEAQFNALFTDYDNGDYSLITGSAAIGAGETLAAAYDDGLDASTDWGGSATLPTIVTKQQTGRWDVGAYVS
jgi:hypothetical protein